jgi:hypothetical protein
VLDLADQEEVTDFASDFGSIWFQFYDKDESGDFGPGDPWTISIEDGEEDALEEVTVDMDGFVFAGDFEAYWQQVMDISTDEEDWHETQYASSSEGIDNLYEDYPFFQDRSVDETEEVEPGPADGVEDEHEGVESGPADGEDDETEGEHEVDGPGEDDDDEHHLAIVKTTDFDLLDDGLVLLSGSLLYDGDAPDTETGFLISDSLLLGDDEFEPGSAVDEDEEHEEFEPGPADGEEHGHEHEVSVIAIDRNDDGDFSFEFEPSLSGATYYYRAYAINEAGVSYGAPRKFVSEHFDDSSHDEESDDSGEGENVEDDDPWAEATPLEGGWLDVPWFGALLTFDDNDWVFHDGLGWLYTVTDGEGGVWLWQEERGWLWTKSGLWPYLYCYDHAEWIYFLANREGRAYFYNYSTNSAE